MQPGRGRSAAVTDPRHGCCRSWACPGLIHRSLLQKDQFGMYALYSKNKPKSDSLLASHGNTFFKVSATAHIHGFSWCLDHCPVLPGTLCLLAQLCTSIRGARGPKAVSALGRCPAHGSIHPVSL